MKVPRETWKPRPELHPLRYELMAKMRKGEITKEEYRAAYRKAYYALPDVIAKQAAGGMMGPTLTKAVIEMAQAAATLPHKPCAVCGKKEHTKWLVLDQGAKVEDHPWFCAEHRVMKMNEQRLALFEESGTNVVDIVNKLLVAYGGGAVRAISHYVACLSLTQLRTLREAEFERQAKVKDEALKKAGLPPAYRPPKPWAQSALQAPVVKPATTPPQPVKTELDRLLD